MAGDAGNLIDLLLFYTLERKLFNRLVGPMGKNPKTVKMAIAFWLMLEEMGFREFTRTVQSHDDSTVAAILKETLNCLSLVHPGANEPIVEGETLVFEAILDEPLNRRFFYYNSEFMFRRFMHIMETVCDRIFGERAALEIEFSENLRILSPFGIRPFGERSSAQMLGSGCGNFVEDNKVKVSSGPLDPEASEFLPKHSDEDCRSMFLTFSKGYPLTREEIFNFFTSKWGDVVKDVVVEETREGNQPVYGRVVFADASMIPRILNGQSKAKFVVGRKHLWARVYKPRRR